MYLTLDFHSQVLDFFKFKKINSLIVLVLAVIKRDTIKDKFIMKCAFGFLLRYVSGLAYLIGKGIKMAQLEIVNIKMKLGCEIAPRVSTLNFELEQENIWQEI